jgi:hypothetical protein
MKLSAVFFYDLVDDDTNTTLTLPAVTVLMTDTGTGRQWSDTAVPMASLFGTGQLPFILPITKRLAAKSQLSVQVFNLFSAQDIAKISLSFIGRKIYL